MFYGKRIDIIKIFSIFASSIKNNEIIHYTFASSSIRSAITDVACVKTKVLKYKGLQWLQTFFFVKNYGNFKDSNTKIGKA